MRDLYKVLNDIIELIPEDHAPFKLQLHSLQTTILYAAPELMKSLWVKAEETLAMYDDLPKEIELKILSVWNGTKKVVINIKHGDFNLSPLAFKLYFKNQNLKVGKWLYTDLDTTPTLLDPISFEETVKDGNSIYEVLDENNRPVTAKYISREDPRLIEIVETLGKDANSFGCVLKIVEIPSDVKYYIKKEYGRETICEEGRTWK